MIRAMKWWDLPEVMDIEHECFGPNAWPVESFWGELARTDRSYCVSEQAAIDGYAGLWLMPPDADVQTIAVAPGAQGRGVGQELLTWLIDDARGHQCRRLTLEVRDDNTAAIRLYAKNGFSEVRRRERYYPDFSDAVVMARSL